MITSQTSTSGFSEGVIRTIVELISFIQNKFRLKIDFITVMYNTVIRKSKFIYFIIY